MDSQVMKRSSWMTQVPPWARPQTTPTALTGRLTTARAASRATSRAWGLVRVAASATAARTVNPLLLARVVCSVSDGCLFIPIRVERRCVGVARQTLSSDRRLPYLLPVPARPWTGAHQGGTALAGRDGHVLVVALRRPVVRVAVPAQQGRPVGPVDVIRGDRLLLAQRPARRRRVAGMQLEFDATALVVRNARMHHGQASSPSSDGSPSSTPAVPRRE